MTNSKTKESSKDLGRLISAHPIAPTYVQRAVFTALLSFLFFLGMMFAFYIRQSFLYFLLATAFLIVYVATMIGWLMQRRNFISVFEYGLQQKKRKIMWTDVASLERSSDGGLKVTTKTGGAFMISSTYCGLDEMAAAITSRISPH